MGGDGGCRVGKVKCYFIVLFPCTAYESLNCIASRLHQVPYPYAAGCLSSFEDFSPIHNTVRFVGHAVGVSVESILVIFGGLITQDTGH